MKLAYIALAGLVLSPLAASAQLVNPRPAANPVSPSPRSPDGVSKADADLPVVLRWRQFLFGSVLGNEAPANYFRLCIYLPAVNSCSTTPHRWTLTAASLVRTAVTTPTHPSRVIAHDYTHTAALSTDYFDEAIEWRVGACASTQETSCTFATTRARLSTKDLRAVNVSDGATTSTRLWLSGEVENQGASSSGSFTTFLTVYTALADEFGRCITDVNAEGVREEDAALTPSGEVLHLSVLPRDANGRYDLGGRQIVAIVDGSLVGEVFESRADLAAGASVTLIEFQEDLSGYTLPATFASRLSTDSRDDVKEYDESDNMRSECHTVYGG